ncbi:MAG: TolC family protein [Halarcobacter sp.]
MLKRSFLLLFFISTFLSAKNIDEIVENSFKKNYSLKALEESINDIKQQISLSSKWKNPTLSFGATDVQFNDSLSRDKEPMQAQFIGFSQVVPLGDKLEVEKDIALNDYEISKYIVEDKKLLYKSKIYEYIYNIKLLEERLSLFEKFKVNTKKLEDLFTQLYKYNKASQKEILNTQIIYHELNLKTQKLKSMLNIEKIKLEEISYEKYKNIDIDMEIKKINLFPQIDKHPKILSLKESSKKFENISKLEKEKKNSDINFTLTYFQRDNKYDDYVNFAVAIPLSIYGSEDIKSRKAKFKTLELDNNVKDMKNSFKNQINILQENLNVSCETVNIINKDILSRFEQLQKVLESYNNFNSYKNIDSKSLIKNFNEIIKYKLKVVDEKEIYFNSLAKSIYFTKGIR